MAHMNAHCNWDHLKKLEYEGTLGPSFLLQLSAAGWALSPITLQEDIVKFSLWYLYRKCVKKVGSGMQLLGGFLILDVIDYLVWPYGRYPEHFVTIHVIIELGGQEEGNLEDIEGSWLETWRTGSSLMSWMPLFDPKDHILKVSGCYPHVLLSYIWFRSKWPTSVVRLG